MTSFPLFRSRSGSALLIILGCVALLTVLVLSFFVTARTEFNSSSFYSRGVNTELLSENVINYVTAQLREGARSTDATTGATVAWASQPGMIRTYDTSGNPYKYFKLYSWDAMVGTGLFDETQATETPPASWASLPNIYTDLNEPMTIPTVASALYPIIDPTAMGTVEGFSYSAAPGATATQALPMPVKWLYILKNGTLSTGVQVGAGTAVTVNSATATNPIIGRVAFWTDDESCKVNINTASEGVFWDQPYGNNTNEMGIHDHNSVAPFGFAESLPNGSEFARVPGHPAETSLSPVFGYGTNPLLPDTNFTLSDPNTLTWPLTPATYAAAFGPYYELTPRYQAGGTMGGAQYAPQTFVPPGYRLYDSVDELSYDPARTSITSNGSSILYPAANGAQPAGRAALTKITPQVIAQRRFFITAHSRAPEETLFGTPRISLWPLQDSTQTLVPRTAKDSLLAFCSTINGLPYYFQRAGFYQYQAFAGGPVTYSPTPIPSCLSATEDFPGPPSTVGGAPKTGVARNEDLYAYLQALTGGATGTGLNIPGFGGNFYAKYPGAVDSTGFLVSDRDEILTQMFDVLRSGVNTFNTTANVLPHYTYTPWKANMVIDGGPGDNPYNGPQDPGETIPINITSNHTHGLGRTYNFGGVSLVFMAQNMDLNSGTAATQSVPATPAEPAGTPDPNNPTRMSIGVGLPWACAIDNANFFTAPPYQVVPPASPIPTPSWLYWDRAANGRYGAYVYQAANPQTGAAAMLVPIDPTTNQPKVDGNGHAVPLPSTAVTIADPQTTYVQAYIILQPFTAMQGVPALAPNIRVRISNLDQLTVSFNHLSGISLGFPSGSSAVVTFNTQNNATTDSMGGLLSPFNAVQPSDVWSGGLSGIVTAANTLVANALYNDGTNPNNTTFPWVSVPVRIPTGPSYPSPYGGEDTSTLNQPDETNPPSPLAIHNVTNGGSMSINSTVLKVDVFDANANLASVGATPFQTFYVNVPAMTLPIPTIEMANQEQEACGGAGYSATGQSNNIVGPRIPGYVDSNPSSDFKMGFNAPPNMALNTIPPGTPPGSPMPIFGTYYISGYPGLLYNNATYLGTPNYPAQPGVFQPLNYYWQQPWDVRSFSQRISPWWTQYYGRVTSFPTGGRLICRGDVVRSFVPNPTPGSIDGDMRLLAANPIRTSPAGGSPNLASDDFVPLGAGRSGGFYSSFPTQGPYTSFYIKQLHPMTFDSGGMRGTLNLIPTSLPILQSPLISGNVFVGPIGYISAIAGGIGVTNGQLIPNEAYAYQTAPNVTPELQGAFMDLNSQLPGDWTLGQGPTPDGPYIQKPDEGIQPPGSTIFPYYSCSIGNNPLNTVNISYSPNKEITSPIVFGSLPSRAMQGIPWCTLLFCPNPASNDNGSITAAMIHPGFGASGTASLGATNDPSYFSPPYAIPPDHLFLDLFWMPVVEPYAISEPFSTAGKVNMNYEIVPFGGYIHRSTALHAVMKSTQLLAIPTHYNDLNFTAATATAPPDPTNFAGSEPNVKAFGFWYEDETWGYWGNQYDYANRYGINLNATIDDAASAFQQRFKGLKDIFRSASEICNVFLVPQAIPGLNYSPTATAVPTDASYNSMQPWWANFKLTGDNGREDPYNQIYPRLTTKSNTFQVHMRVQVLTQTPMDRANGVFNPSSGDSITGEYRGSAIIERYLDPNQSNLPDFATTFPANPTGATSTVDNFVRYRVVNTRAFSP